MTKDPYKKVISGNIELDGIGILFKDPKHKITKRERDAILDHIGKELVSSIFVPADACRIAYDMYLEEGMQPDAALMSLAVALAGSKAIGARKGFFAVKRVDMLIRMSRMFPIEYRHPKVGKTHYEALAGAKHVSVTVALGRIQELIDAIEHPDPDNPVDVTVNGTRELIAAEIPAHDRVTSEEFMPIKHAVSCMRRLFKTKKAFMSISKELLHKAIAVSAAMFAAYAQAQAKAMGISFANTGRKSRPGKVKVTKAKVAKAKAKKARKKSSKRKGK